MSDVAHGPLSEVSDVAHGPPVISWVTVYECIIGGNVIDFEIFKTMFVTIF